MKKSIVKLGTLSVLLTAVFLMGNNSTVEASLDCWQIAYNTWQSCDSAYSDTRYAHIYAPDTCAVSSQNSCQQHAPGTPDYNACYIPAYNACIAADQTRFDDRGSTYSTCTGSEGNAGNCIEKPQGFCDDARSRAATCSSLYYKTEDSDAYTTCYNNSGIGQCE